MNTTADRFDLTDKTALVTGGSRGMGREMSLAFAAAGASVAVASRKLDACEAVVKEIRASTGTGARAAAFAANVSRWEECDRLVEEVYAAFGTVDILVNNAGSSPLYPSLAEVGEELFDKVIALNLRGPFRLSSLIGTRMAAGDGGSIINISTIGAIRPETHALPYCSAKAGLEAMTVGMAKAFGPKVRVNCIRPGLFLTDISKAWEDTGGTSLKAAQRVPLGRGGKPDEIVGAALYLASSASSYTTGAILNVDGGLADTT